MRLLHPVPHSLLRLLHWQLLLQSDAGAILFTIRSILFGKEIGHAGCVASIPVSVLLLYPTVVACRCICFIINSRFTTYRNLPYPFQFIPALGRAAGAVCVFCIGVDRMICLLTVTFYKNMKRMQFLIVSYFQNNNNTTITTFSATSSPSHYSVPSLPIWWSPSGRQSEYSDRYSWNNSITRVIMSARENQSHK